MRRRSRRALSGVHEGSFQLQLGLDTRITSPPCMNSLESVRASVPRRCGDSIRFQPCSRALVRATGNAAAASAHALAFQRAGTTSSNSAFGARVRLSGDGGSGCAGVGKDSRAPACGRALLPHPRHSRSGFAGTRLPRGCHSGPNPSPFILTFVAVDCRNRFRDRLAVRSNRPVVRNLRFAVPVECFGITRHHVD